jgi:hypothetical protein
LVEAETYKAKLLANVPSLPVFLGLRHDRHTLKVGEYGLMIDAFVARHALMGEGFEDCFIVWETRDAALVSVEDLLGSPRPEYRVVGIEPPDADALRAPAAWTHYPGTERADHYRINPYARVDRLVVDGDGKLQPETGEDPYFQRLVAVDELLFRKEKNIEEIREAYLAIARDTTVTCATARLSALASAAEVDHYFDGTTSGRIRSIALYTTLHHDAAMARVEALRQLAAIELCALTMELSRSGVGDLSDTRTMARAIVNEWGPEYRVHFTARLMDAETEYFDGNHEVAEERFASLLRDIEDTPYARERTMATLFRSANFRKLGRFREALAASESVLDVDLPPEEAWRFRTKTLDMRGQAAYSALENARGIGDPRLIQRYSELYQSMWYGGGPQASLDRELLF